VIGGPSAFVRNFSIFQEVFLQPLVSLVILCRHSTTLRSDERARAQQHHGCSGGPMKEERSGLQAGGAQGNESTEQDEQCEFGVIIRN
jgi:hypothetical protein